MKPNLTEIIPNGKRMNYVICFSTKEIKQFFIDYAKKYNAKFTDRKTFLYTCDPVEGFENVSALRTSLIPYGKLCNINPMEKYTWQEIFTASMSNQYGVNIYDCNIEEEKVKWLYDYLQKKPLNEKNTDVVFWRKTLDFYPVEHEILANPRFNLMLKFFPEVIESDQEKMNQLILKMIDCFKDVHYYNCILAYFTANICECPVTYHIDPLNNQYNILCEHTDFETVIKQIDSQMSHMRNML